MDINIYVKQVKMSVADISIIAEKALYYGSYLTTYSLLYLGNEQVQGFYPNNETFSLPARCLIDRYNLYQSGKYPTLEIWSLQTLKNIVLTNRRSLCRELKVNEKIDDETLLWTYFPNQQGKCLRQQLQEYILEMIEIEKEKFSESLIGYLGAGIFIFQGGYQRLFRTWADPTSIPFIPSWYPISLGNFHLLAEEDIQMLSDLLGLSGDKFCTCNIISLLVAEQNRYIEEVFIKSPHFASIGSLVQDVSAICNI